MSSRATILSAGVALALGLSTLSNASPNGEGQPGGPEGEHRMGPPSPDQIFKEIDADGDGSISLEEFTAHHEERMSRGGSEGPMGPQHAGPSRRGPHHQASEPMGPPHGQRGGREMGRQGPPGPPQRMAMGSSRHQGPPHGEASHGPHPGAEGQRPQGPPEHRSHRPDQRPHGPHGEHDSQQMGPPEHGPAGGFERGRPGPPPHAGSRGMHPRGGEQAHRGPHAEGSRRPGPPHGERRGPGGSRSSSDRPEMEVEEADADEAADE